jgi:transcriptional regulator with XRE-family HTH domain
VSIGEVLAEARHERGFTVAEVSHYTRIREPVIRAIEQDDFLTSGTASQARGHIRTLASALGVDPSPLIKEFDATDRFAPKIAAIDEGRSTLPLSRLERDGSFGIIERRRVSWLPVLAALALAGLGFAVYYFFVLGAGSPGPSPSRAARSAPASSAAVAVNPASVVAFGPDGTGDGDNPQLAFLAVDHNPATAWTTDWYGTPNFPSLQPGTGLLLDIGHEVTITSAEVTLGSAAGGGFQMRVGNAPVLADLHEVAVAMNARGALGVRFAAPVRARYVLIWFTALPPSGLGTFQASVYNITVKGHSL